MTIDDDIKLSKWCVLLTEVCVQFKRMFWRAWPVVPSSSLSA